MLTLKDKPKIKCSRIAQELYNFLFWLAVQKQSFFVEFNDIALAKKLSKTMAVWESGIKKATQELIKIGLIYETDERIVNKSGLSVTVYMMKDPRAKCNKVN